MVETNNTRVISEEQLIEPSKLHIKFPIEEDTSLHVEQSRTIISNILNGDDNRMMVIVWPCSIHDPASALEYAYRLKDLQGKLDDLYLVMRVYFEKPRTISWWKWLIRDPHLDGSNNMNLWLDIARKLLKDIAELEVPIWTEQLDVITPQYTSDFISYSAIGARSTEDQWHREMGSMLSSPVWFKNGTWWNTKLALDAIEAASTEDRFVWINNEWKATNFITSGNPDAHIILRGGGWKVNYQLHDIENVAEKMQERWMSPKIVVDASHQNSPKWFHQQLHVIRDIISQITDFNNTHIQWVMLESHIEEWKQWFKYWETSVNELNPNQSITDWCIWWEDTETILTELNQAVWIRNKRNS